MAISSLIAVAISLSWILGSCNKDISTKDLTLLPQEIPDGFPAPNYTFQDNPLNKEGFELGRKLFYDGRLAIDNQTSCASCHQQIGSFGTFEHDLSHGVNNSHTNRNAPVLFNLAWNKYFHWDGEFSSLNNAITQPILGHIEMGETFQGIVDKIKTDADYKQRFKKVFHSSFIQSEFIVKALAQFTGYMVSANSKYDRHKKGTANFTSQEINGYNIYKANCATCHTEPMFTDHSFRNIGLPINNFLKDYGRIRVTGKNEDSLKFKVPTLRNSAISSNYMHDGRFGTLAQCINHYRTGVQQSSTLDPLLTNGITLTNTQTSELVSFLRTLTDSAFLSDTRFSKPN